MDDDNAYLAEVSDIVRPDNLAADSEQDEPAKVEQPAANQSAVEDVSKMTRPELLAAINERWDSDPESPAFADLKRRDVSRYKKAKMVELLTKLNAQSVGRVPLPTEFGEVDNFNPTELNPDALETLGEAMATFNRITVEVVEKASQVWQPGGYVLEGTGDYLGRPDVHTAMKGVMKEIALEAGPSDPIVQLVSSPWARYGLIMSAAMGSTAKKVTAAPPL